MIFFHRAFFNLRVIINFLYFTKGLINKQNDSNFPLIVLKKFFEYLETDKVTLRSCLLVNRLWCHLSLNSNLQEMTLSFEYQNAFEDFKELKYVTFPQSQIVKFQYEC